MKLLSLRGVLEFESFQPLRHLFAGNLCERVQFPGESEIRVLRTVLPGTLRRTAL